MTGYELAELRKAAGLSQAELAQMIQTHQKTVAYWEAKRDEEIATRGQRGEALGLIATTLRQMRALRELDPTNADEMVPAPADFGDIIRQGDMLLIADRPAGAGDIVVTFDLEGRAERLGRVHKTERGDLALLDQRGTICDLPDPTDYRVIAYHVLASNP